MSPQIVCMRRGIVTLVAFVWLFSTVCFQMCPQIACQRWGIVTLVASVWLFSAVGFQMCPQIACLRWGKVTLVAFVWLFSTVLFQMSPQILYHRGCIVTLVAFVCPFFLVMLTFATIGILFQFAGMTGILFTVSVHLFWKFTSGAPRNLGAPWSKILESFWAGEPLS